MTDDGTNGQVLAQGIERSESLAKLFGAMATAQGTMEAASKDATNPHYGSRYADLAAVIAAAREPLSKAALAVMQPIVGSSEKSVTVRTIIGHSSGEWLASDVEVAVAPNVSRDGKQQPWIHAFGSAVTYARRYALQSLLCLPAEDDDGNAAGDAGSKPGQRPASRQEIPNEGGKWCPICYRIGTLADHRQWNKGWVCRKTKGGCRLEFPIEYHGILEQAPKPPKKSEPAKPDVVGRFRARLVVHPDHAGLEKKWIEAAGVESLDHLTADQLIVLWDIIKDDPAYKAAEAAADTRRQAEEVF